MQIASDFGGSWNVQTGFEFDDLSNTGSADLRVAMSRLSPLTEYYIKSVLPWVGGNSPDIIGFSIASPSQLIPSAQLVWLLRKAGFIGSIVWGGNTVTRLSKSFKGLDWLFDIIDYLVVFQGEEPFYQLVLALQNGTVLRRVPNLIYKSRGKVEETATLPAPSPNSLNTPYFTGFPIGEYWGVNYLPLLASRGCYYNKCSFCAIPYGYGNNGFTGFRHASKVVNDIVQLIDRHKINRFKFVDEALSPRGMMDIAQNILSLDLQVEWEAYARLENIWLDDSFLKTISRAGFKKAYFGLELVAGNSRKVLRKHDNAAQTYIILNKCSEYGIKVHLFCMFGYPGTGLQEAEDTVEFVLENRGLVDTADFNAFTYSRHTNVEGIRKVSRPENDLVLEYKYTPLLPGILSYESVERLTAELEEIVWQSCPRLLHPTYRMVSPWGYQPDRVKQSISMIDAIPS